MKVLVGTASWSDKSLVASKKFYPKKASTPEGRLRFYATQFPLVEVDTSYYAIPLAATSQAWSDRTPVHFTLNMKAFRLFTGHATSPKVLPPDLRAELPAMETANFYFKDVPAALRDALWQRFKDALEPLRAAGKLGMVHFSVRAVGAQQPRRPRPRRPLRRGDEGLHRQRRVQEQDLVR